MHINFIKNLLTVKSNDCKFLLGKLQTSGEYNNIVYEVNWFEFQQDQKFKVT